MFNPFELRDTPEARVYELLKNTADGFEKHGMMEEFELAEMVCAEFALQHEERIWYV